MHHCDLAVIKCIDFRFRESDQEFIRSTFSTEDFDMFAWPGAAKQSLDSSIWKNDFIAKVKNVCIGLHGVRKLVLLWHWDCGGYGGSKAFASESAEESKYRSDLQTVKDSLVKHLPDLEIEMAYSKAIAEDELEYTLIR
ncbi:MAG: hypothetical protein NUV82_03845 [Candidatus Komeilibacteria bacterium]|nr:hypothetical protein [Candidatus Komeilibacteria bacterium]